ncbi:hypothetical protein [Hyalangium gracile]|uniref:hypothetical protein n=1 Tax=Hyalangium gracile TaxID=394092 RepID=UPI001CC92680|nr:hypothetical protein [Hyalangium gracile]
MSTPGAIAVYTSGSGVPEQVSERPWRGVYHHWDGNPEGLGQHLIQRVQSMEGDMRAVVRQLIDEAPWGWSNCINVPMQGATERGLLKSLQSVFGATPREETSTERFTQEEPGPAVSSQDPNAVAYVYVFDLEARRLDAFATYFESGGKRIGSIAFSPTGAPDKPALDLLAEETVEEAPLLGKELSPEALKDWLDGLPGIEGDSTTLHWVTTEQQPDGSLTIVFRVVTWEEEILTAVVEREWNVVPATARREPDRVRHLLEALVEVVGEDPRRVNAFWIAGMDPLRRSGARQRASFANILRAHAARDFGAAGQS